MSVISYINNYKKLDIYIMPKRNRNLQKVKRNIKPFVYKYWNKISTPQILIYTIEDDLSSDSEIEYNDDLEYEYN